MKFVLMWSMFSTGYITGALVGALIGAAAGLAASLAIHAIRKSRRTKAVRSLNSQGYQVLYGDDRLGLILLGSENGQWAVVPRSGTPVRPYAKSQLSGCELISRSKSWLTVRIQAADPRNPVLELPVALAPRNAAFNQEMNEKAKAFLDALQSFCGKEADGETAEEDGAAEAQESDAELIPLGEEELPEEMAPEGEETPMETNPGETAGDTGAIQPASTEEELSADAEPEPAEMTSEDEPIGTADDAGSTQEPPSEKRE